MGSALTQFVLLWWMTDEARFVEDLGADSLDSVELLMAFEEEFNIEITGEAAEAVATVGEVIVGIENAVGVG